MNTPEEIKAALDRLSSHVSRGGNRYYKNDMPGCVCDDEVILANAYIAEHPADDDLPIDHAWLKTLNLPFKSVQFHCCHIRGFFATQHGSNLILRKLKTRGEARQLLRGLGIDFKEFATQ